ncbi:hypothetical protein ACRDNQ_05490 [Palleronia sp. KMU-117]|uniref:hypothetical protein n=1 Tax=Palleronia sp. KMU-117 TaxID=3434108 RepID=UPI003D741B97
MPFDPYVPATALAYVLLQVPALLWLTGAWARAAMVPAVAMAGALLVFILGMMTPLPLTILPLALGLPLGVLYLAALWLARMALSLRRSA